jgi:hypothetical protein
MVVVVTDADGFKALLDWPDAQAATVSTARIRATCLMGTSSSVIR